MLHFYNVQDLDIMRWSLDFNLDDQINMVGLHTESSYYFDYD